MFALDNLLEVKTYLQLQLYLQLHFIVTIKSLMQGALNDGKPEPSQTWKIVTVGIFELCLQSALQALFTIETETFLKWKELWVPNVGGKALYKSWPFNTFGISNVISCQSQSLSLTWIMCMLNPGPKVFVLMQRTHKPGKPFWLNLSKPSTITTTHLDITSKSDLIPSFPSYCILKHIARIIIRSVFGDERVFPPVLSRRSRFLA